LSLPEEKLRRTVFDIAWPAVLRTSLNMFVNIADMIMIGSLGAEAIAAVGIANQLFFFCIGAIQAFAIGTTTLVAQHIGAEDPQGAREVVAQSVAMALIITSILSVLGYIFDVEAIRAVLFAMAEPDPEVIAIGSTYLRIISLSIVFRFTMVVINSAFQGAGDSKTPLCIMVLSNLINLGGNALLIFGLGPFPRMGATGAAIATALSGVVGFIVAATLLFTPRCPFQFKFPVRFRFHWHLIKRVLGVGAPATIEQLTINFSNLIYTAFVATLGTVAIAANQILMSAFQITFLPGIGFAMTATTLVGQYLGAQKRGLAVKSGVETTRFAWILTGAVGLVFLLFPRAVLGMFVDDSRVIEMAVSSLYILAIVQPSLAVVASLSGGLRGAGDTRWVMYVTVSTMLVMRLLLTFAFIQLGLGLSGVWLAAGLEIVTRAIFIHRRFHRIVWQVDSLVGRSA